MKRWKLCAAMLLLPIMILCWEGCAHKLELGGAYRPATTNAAGIVVDASTPDYAFFSVDLAFSTAYSAVDAVFKFERDNRVALWKVSPNIKHTLDNLRPKVWDVVRRYARARKAYLSNPLPAGLTTLQTVLGEIQKLAGAAARVVPVKGGI